jgi:DUF971 family protein
MSQPWPSEIRLNPAKDALTVGFEDGVRNRFSAEMLRVLSPSAEVQGHGAGQAKLVPGKRLVTIMAVEPVGNYAIRLTFSDGHDTGIYTWDFFRDLGSRYDERQRAYFGALDAAGMSRG